MPTVTLEIGAYREQIFNAGYAIHPDVIDAAMIERLRHAVEGLEDRQEVRRRKGTYGIRHLLRVVPMVRELAKSHAIRALVVPVLGSCCFSVRGMFFDKIAGANWKVSWHQDRVIAVHEKVEVTGLGPWSNKAGIWQVEPPVEVLEKMLAVRIHLDASEPENGDLRVLPGSHAHGWLDDEIDGWKSEVQEVTCAIPCGGALVMRPLILHASSSSDAPTHRRVIHLEYAADDLPGGLEWDERVGPVS